MSNYEYLGKKISIHAPTRGATPLSLCQCHSRMNFNPRSHERSDPCTNRKGGLMDISIHAPTRGATIKPHYAFYDYKFQSTLPREERRRTKQWVVDDSLFQSTLPREERRKRGIFYELRRNFNPRSHERSDGAVYYIIYLSRYFNPRSHERSDADESCNTAK